MRRRKRSTRRPERLALALALLVVGCNDLRRKSVAIDAAAPDAASPAAPPVDVPVTDLPLGTWESEDGPRLCLSLLPYGGVRFATPVPFYRHDARVNGRIDRVTHGHEPDTWVITVDVTNILAKEIGSCHRAWRDFSIHEAEVLGVRMTSPDPTAQHSRGAASEAPEPNKAFTLRFDAAREHVEVCAASEPRDAAAPKCRRLTRKPSPTAVTLPYSACRTDGDCKLAYEGELCTPCVCSNAAIAVEGTYQKQKNDSALRDECGPIARVQCPPCPDGLARCRANRCVFTARDAGP